MRCISKTLHVQRKKASKGMNKTLEFVRLVAKMRKMQKLYFKNKTRSTLDEAKRLEDSVDRMLEEFGFEKMKAQQMTLEDIGQKVN